MAIKNASKYLDASQRISVIKDVAETILYNYNYESENLLSTKNRLKEMTEAERAENNWDYRCLCSNVKEYEIKAEIWEKLYDYLEKLCL